MNKASGGDGIPFELFQILKDDAVKVLHSICPQIQKSQQWPQDWKRSVFILIPKKGNAKEYAEYIMRNAGLDEAQTGIKIARRNINNLRYADGTTLMVERGTKEPLDES